MAQLIQKISKKIAVDYRRLSIISNPDGFLEVDSVRRALYKESGLTVVSGTNLYLRVHFETVYKSTESERFVYICYNTASLVPDMLNEAYFNEFTVADLFPLFADKSVLFGLSLAELCLVEQKSGIRRVPMADCKKIVEEAKSEVQKRSQESSDHFKHSMDIIEVDWVKDADKNIESISACMVAAIKYNVYDAVAPRIAEFNNQFQSWIDQNYFACLNSNPLLKPKAVNKILPHIAMKRRNDDKVALIVVDGLSYWQYYILECYLTQKGVHVNKGTTLAWLPSITMLSRQAIFRGDSPIQDYHQSPQNEQRLWRDYWVGKGISEHAIQYISDSDVFEVRDSVRRLAYVTVEMDEKMHSSSNYRDLLSLTENWRSRIAEKIIALREKGFIVYLTTDHGSVLSHGWKPISAADKVFLYKDGSRGKRHLIYNNSEHKETYFAAHSGEINLLSHDTWLSVRDDSCFDRKGQQMITHGGSHFWEVVIPFATIE